MIQTFGGGDRNIWQKYKLLVSSRIANPREAKVLFVIKILREIRDTIFEWMFGRIGWAIYTEYEEMVCKRGKMLWNVQQKRENAIKCSTKEGKCYEMFSKGGKML